MTSGKKIVFKRRIIRDKVDQYIIILILQENVIILSLYKPNDKASSYVKQKWTELLEEIDKPPS